MKKIIDIPDNLIDKLKELATKANRTVKNYIESLVIKNIEENEIRK